MSYFLGDGCMHAVDSSTAKSLGQKLVERENVVLVFVLLQFLLYPL